MRVNRVDLSSGKPYKRFRHAEKLTVNRPTAATRRIACKKENVPRPAMRRAKNLITNTIVDTLMQAVKFEENIFHLRNACAQLLEQL